MKSEDQPKIICLLGPTGSGKTEISLAVAKECNGVVINVDSRQVYADFPVITAQPGAREKAACPHRLYGFLPSTDKMSVGVYIERARRAIGETLAEGKLPLLVGGTGMYIRSLIDGIAEIPAVPKDISDYWAKRCQEEGAAGMHRLLAEKDPTYAAKIHPNDRQRVARALEVFDATGHPLSWWHERPLERKPYNALRLGTRVTLDVLTPRLWKRIQIMLEAGAIEEAEVARENCRDPEAPGWSGIGCGELWRYLNKELSLDEACELWMRNTRAYAKRQLTWFAKEPEVRWLPPEAVDEYVKKASHFLK